MQFDVYNILTLIDEENGMGEKAVQNLLSHFSCPRSTEIEYFLKNNAIDFSKRRMSITYLVLDENMLEDSCLVRQNLFAKNFLSSGDNN